MSNDNAGEKPARRKPKVSLRNVNSAQGESAPKARTKVVVDGKQVNIPAPRVSAMEGRRRLGVPGVGCPGERR